MNLKELTKNLKEKIPDKSKYYTPVAIEKQMKLGEVGLVFNHFAISGMDSKSDPDNIELLAPFENAPHTNVGILLEHLESLGEETSNIKARVGPKGEKLEILDVVSYLGFYVIIKGE